MSNTVILVATLPAKPGALEELRSILVELAGHSRIEPGNISYDMHQSNDDPEELVMIEHWRSQALFDEHLNQPYTVAAFARLPSVLRTDPRMQFITALP
jgi:quinol monooxygenase YgiN